MATIIELSKLGGPLIKYDPALPADQQELRLLYGSQRLASWVKADLPGMGSTWDIETTPLEQFDAYMAVYASGETLTYGYQFNPIRYIQDGIWELKTADLRIFGWFYRKDCFIGVLADGAERIKTVGLYYGYAGEVQRFRDGLDLDAPKFVPGDNPNDVVSNYDLP